MLSKPVAVQNGPFSYLILFCDEHVTGVLKAKEGWASGTASKVILELSNSMDMLGTKCNKNKTISLYVYPWVKIVIYNWTNYIL